MLVTRICQKKIPQRDHRLDRPIEEEEGKVPQPPHEADHCGRQHRSHAALQRRQQVAAPAQLFPQRAAQDRDVGDDDEQPPPWWPIDGSHAAESSVDRDPHSGKQGRGRCGDHDCAEISAQSNQRAQRAEHRSLTAAAGKDYDGGHTRAERSRNPEHRVTCSINEPQRGTPADPREAECQREEAPDRRRPPPVLVVLNAHAV